MLQCCPHPQLENGVQWHVNSQIPKPLAKDVQTGDRAFLVEKIPRRSPPLSHAAQELSVTSSWDMERGNKPDYLPVAS